jgi:dolichol-phosphate mannosyltransferase
LQAANVGQYSESVRKAKAGLEAYPTKTGPRLLVSMATYNERDNLKPLIEEIHAVAPAADVLVTDDHSPDGTGELADELAAADPRVQVLHRAGKLGLGSAILAAMRYAMDHDYDLFVNMDADFSHHPRFLPAILAGMSRYDVMIGSRYIRGGGTANWPLARRLMSFGVNLVVRALMRSPAKDCSGGYRCYRVARLRRARLHDTISRGYSFQQEVLYRCRKAGCRIGETPILFENRKAGDSKVSAREAVRSMSLLVWLGLEATFGAGAPARQRPSRPLAPASVASRPIAA